MNSIDWNLIAEAVNFYKKIGYTYIETSWFCNSEALSVTLPKDKNGIKAWHPVSEFGYLVGSAEQSFIQMMLEGKLPKGLYCAATPCFRDDAIDELHFNTFFKVELIEVSPINSGMTVPLMISDAREFMEEHTNQAIELVKTDVGYDLNINNIEVGSYGYRKYKDINWIYGTGLALPRFSQAK